MNKFPAFLLAFLMSCHCQSSVSSSPTDVSPKTPQDTEWCSVGCKHLQTLTGRDGKAGCEESRSLDGPNGEIVTCEQFCRESQDKGRNLYPSCWAEAKSCTDIEGYRKRPFPCEGH